MKIALLGYGKMGKTIESLALQQEDEIVLRIGSGNAVELTTENLRRAEVAIEFSRPEVAYRQVTACLEAGVPVVCGTTGWLDRMPEAEALCKARQGALVYASNFSIGVNIFFEINRRLAELMRSQPQYRASIEEIHHLQKLDAPSGTAITLAEDILRNSDQWKAWALAASNLPADTLPITAGRVPDVPGSHIVSYQSAVDMVQIAHHAYSRDGFAAGALQAAAWVMGRTGMFGMKEVLFG